MTSRPALYSILVVNLLRAAATTLLLLLLTSATAQVRLTVAIPEDPGSLDPAAATSTSALLVTNQVYDTLFDISPEGQVEGRLAAEWSYADATRLRVRLVPDVTFSDGAPLDAAAVQASLLRFLALREERPAGALLETVTAVEVQDALTVVVETSEPFAPLTAHLAHPATAIVPGGRGRDLAVEPVGSGPFELVEWLPSERLLLRANSDHRGDPPPIPELELLVGLSTDALLEGLGTGAVDLAVGLAPHAFGSAAALSDGSAELELRTGWSAVHLGMNARHAALAEVEVRQALALAIDKGSLVDALPSGSALPASAVLPPTVRLAPALSEEAYPYEPEAARSLLAEAGRQELTLTLDLESDPELEVVALELRRMLADVGVTLELRVHEPDRFQQQLESPELQLYLARWSTPTLDPDQTLHRVFHSGNIPQGNASRYRVAAVDALLQEARNSTSEAVRSADYLDVAEAVLTDLPVITLYYPRFAVARSARLSTAQVGVPWFRLDLAGADLRD